jgi:hypothetical protein
MAFLVVKNRFQNVVACSLTWLARLRTSTKLMDWTTVDNHVRMGWPRVQIDETNHNSHQYAISLLGVKRLTASAVASAQILQSSPPQTSILMRSQDSP